MWPLWRFAGLWMEQNSKAFEDTEGTLESLWDRIKYWVTLWIFDTKDFRSLLFSDLVEDWDSELFLRGYLIVFVYLCKSILW